MLRLLVVDDEETICFAISEYFRMLNYEVDVAHDAACALEHIRSHRYSAAIIDLRLHGSGDLSGFEVMRNCRDSGRVASRILLTAHSGVGVTTEARLNGAHVVLNKPVSIPQIALLLAKLAEQRPPSPPGE